MIQRFVRPLLATWSLLACAFLAAPSALHAQSGTGTVTGRVLNQANNEYLRNAVVSVVGTDISTTAEAGGVYRLLNVPASARTIRFTYAGLETKDETVNVPAGQTLTLDVTMQSVDAGVLKLESFVVTTEREGNAKVIMEQKNSIEAKRVLFAFRLGHASPDRPPLPQHVVIYRLLN